jgi:hypothetical protein
MATNKPVGDNARKGAVKNRSQLATKTNGEKDLHEAATRRAVNSWRRRRRPSSKACARRDSRALRITCKGHTIEEPAPPERTDDVINLMDALRQSLGKRAKTSTKGRRTKAKRTRKAA